MTEHFEWRKEAADIPPSKVQNGLCSTRQILALFRGQPWGDCSETGWRVYGPFRTLRCHLEQKLKPKLRLKMSGYRQKLNKTALLPTLLFCLCVNPPTSDLLVGLVVKASSSRAEDPAFESRLPGAWRYRVSAGTGPPGVSIL